MASVVQLFGREESWHGYHLSEIQYEIDFVAGIKEWVQD